MVFFIFSFKKFWLLYYPLPFYIHFVTEKNIVDISNLIILSYR